MKFKFMLFAFLLQGVALSAQPDSAFVPNYKSRKLIVGGGAGLFCVGSLTYLNAEWYKPYNTGRFHFFNDNAEWLQVDKVGHAYSAYQGSRLMMEAFAWAGFKKNTRTYVGGSLAFVYLSAVEIMDGYSRGWGFSWGDMCSNFLGTSMAITQQQFWNEQKILLKYSYAESGLSRYNPNLLGNDLPSRLLKDYNSQIYWLSFNPVTLFKKNSRFPAWLNVAFGYGANGMTGGHTNQVVINDKGQLVRFTRIRQYLFSVDINLQKIPCRNKALKTLFSVLNTVKIPAPALIFSRNSAGFGIF